MARSAADAHTPLVLQHAHPAAAAVTPQQQGVLSRPVYAGCMKEVTEIQTIGHRPHHWGPVVLGPACVIDRYCCVGVCNIVSYCIQQPLLGAPRLKQYRCLLCGHTLGTAAGTVPFWCGWGQSGHCKVNVHHSSSRCWAAQQCGWGRGALLQPTQLPDIP